MKGSEKNQGSAGLFVLGKITTKSNDEKSGHNRGETGANTNFFIEEPSG